ncbi:MAG: PilZ domain-containing protein [Henriciella sp.]
MFSSKSKNKINIERAVSGSARPVPVVRPSVNNRRGPRKGVWCVCAIETRGGEVREGVIVDISKTGARIRFRSRGTLPKVVRIKASRIGLARFARVVWQSEFDAGIEFVPDNRVAG